MVNSGRQLPGSKPSKDERVYRWAGGGEKRERERERERGGERERRTQKERERERERVKKMLWKSRYSVRDPSKLQKKGRKQIF